MSLLEVPVYIRYEPPQKSKCCPSGEEAESAQEQRVPPLHIHNGGHRILDKAPCMLKQVIWIQVAGAILENCTVVLLFDARWYWFISHRYPSVLNHLYAGPK